MARAKHEELSESEKVEVAKFQEMADRCGFEIVHYPDCEMKFGIFAKRGWGGLTFPCPSTSANVPGMKELRYFMRGLSYHARLQRAQLGAQLGYND